MNSSTHDNSLECSTYTPIQATHEIEPTYDSLEPETEITCDSCLHFNGNTCKLFNQDK